MINANQFGYLGFVFMLIAIVDQQINSNPQSAAFIVAAVACWGFQAVLEQLQKRR